MEERPSGGQSATATHVTRGSGVLLGAATLSQFGGSVAQQGTVVLGVFWAAAYGLSLAQMGALVSALTLGLVVSGLVVGTLVDRFGPRRVLFAGTLLVVVIAVAIGATHLLWLTVALLFMLGLVLGVVPVSGSTTILAAWPRERRGLPMGIRQMAVPGGAMVAALALPALAARYGPQPLYFGFAVLLAVGGLAFCAVLPAHTARVVASPLEGTLLRREVRRIAVPAAAGFLMVWGQYALATYTIPYLHAHQGIAIAVAGVLLAVSQIGGAAARVVLGHVSDRLGGRRDVVLTLTATGGAVLACVLAVLPSAMGLLVLAPLWLVLGAAMVGWNALMLTWAGERVSPHNAGAAIGLTTSALLLGATISAPAFGLIVEAGGGYRTAWLVLAVILAAAALLLAANRRLAAREVRATARERTAAGARAGADERAREETGELEGSRQR